MENVRDVKSMEQIKADNFNSELEKNPLVHYEAETKIEPFKWTATKVKACFLLSLDKYVQADICEYLKINNSTLSTWKSNPEFKERMNELILTSGHSDKPVRVAGQKKLIEKLETVLLNKLDNTEEVSDAPLASLLGKYSELSKVIQKETETGGFVSRGGSGKSINVLELIKNGDSKQKNEVIGILKNAVLQAISEKRNPQGLVDSVPTGAKIAEGKTAESSEVEILPIEGKEKTVNGETIPSKPKHARNKYILKPKPINAENIITRLSIGAEKRKPVKKKNTNIISNDIKIQMEAEAVKENMDSLDSYTF